MHIIQFKLFGLTVLEITRRQPRDNRGRFTSITWRDVSPVQTRINQDAFVLPAIIGLAAFLVGFAALTFPQ